VAQRAEAFATKNFSEETQKTTAGKLEKQAFEGQLRDLAKRTVWLWLVFLLHLAAIISAALMYWIGRHEGRPLPQIALTY
jgi:hypothetical protein